MFLQLIASFAVIALVIPVASKGVIAKRRSIGECHQFYKNGDCQCCEDKFRGSKCEHHCEKCITIENMCAYLCKDGYYGFTCEHQCPNSCKEGISGLPICIELEKTFECMNGCRKGLFGRQCNNTCSTKCNNSICNKITGICVECQDNYFGENCDKNCLNCVGGCFRNGTCEGGCKAGYRRPLCDTKCFTSCEQCNETCSKQCQESCPETVFETCTQNSTCAYTCSGFYENDQICSKKIGPPEKVEETEGSSTLVIAIVVTVIVVIAVIAGCYIKRRRGGGAFRSRKTRTVPDSKRDIPAEDDRDRPTHGESTDQISDTSNEIIQSTTHSDDNDVRKHLLEDRPTDGEAFYQRPDTSKKITRSTTPSAQDDNDTKGHLGDGYTQGESLDQQLLSKTQDDNGTRENLGDGGTQGESLDQQLLSKTKDDNGTKEHLRVGPTHGELFYQRPDTSKKITRSTTPSEIAPDKIPEIGSQIEKGIVVITSSPEGKESITQMLKMPKHRSIKGMKAEFTIGNIGSKDVASIHLTKDQDGKIENANFITSLLGRFKNVEHVIILGDCSVSEKQREVIELGDVVASVSNDDQPYIYVQPSDTEKTFAPGDDTLQNIVRNLIASGDRTPWKKHLVPDNKVPTLHCGIFGTPELSEKKKDDDAIFVLESIKGSGIDSYLLVCAVSDKQNETAESTLAAASVVRAVIEQMAIV